MCRSAPSYIHNHDKFHLGRLFSTYVSGLSIYYSVDDLYNLDGNGRLARSTTKRIHAAKPLVDQTFNIHSNDLLPRSQVYYTTR